MIDSLFSFYREGVLRPGAAEVADRSGLSERTVFRHFAEADLLFEAAAARQWTIYERSFAQHREVGDVVERAEFLAEVRGRLYEEIAPVRRVELLDAPFRPIVAEQLELVHQEGRAQVERIFAGELASIPATKRNDLLSLLDVLTSFACFEELRSSQHLPAARARRVVATGLVGAFAAFGAKTPAKRPAGGGRTAATAGRVSTRGAASAPARGAARAGGATSAHAAAGARTKSATTRTSTAAKAAPRRVTRSRTAGR